MNFIKHNRASLALGVVMAVALASCSDDRYEGMGDTGMVDLQLQVDPTTLSATPEARSSLSQLVDAITANDFTVTLTGEDGNSSSWLYPQFDGSKVKVGTYTLSVSYGKEGEEGFNLPYFYGETSLEVLTDRTTSASVTARLANAAVKVEYTDAFLSYLKEHSASVRTEQNPDGLAIAADVTDELFINPGEAALYVSFTTQKGQKATLKATDFVAQAQHVYIVTVDVNDGQMGDPVLSVTFDDQTIAEPVEFTLSEELLNAPAPTVTPATNAISLVETCGSDASAVMNIMARGRMAEVVMTTVGAEYIDASWPAHVDLLKADASLQSLMKGLGVNVMGLWRNPDQMAVIDFTGLIGKVKPGHVEIRLEVIDKYGKTTEEPALLTIDVAPLTFTLDSFGALAKGSAELTLEVTYNGANASDMQFAYKNDRGTYTTASIISVTPTSQNKYNVTIAVPANDDDVELRAQAGSLTPVYATVRRVDYQLTVDERDVFAHKATLTISSGDFEGVASGSTYALSTDGGKNFTAVTPSVSGNELTLNNLQAGTNYVMTATFQGIKVSTSFTTEAAAQLPNAGMEDWWREKGGTYWDFYSPRAENATQYWDTMNPETTSSPGAGFAYTITSGTKPTDDCVSGSYAALIRTVGWGSGNTSAGVASIIYNVSGGQLYLGSFNAVGETPNYGYTFSSRPSSLSFQAKYAAYKSDDYGTAEVRVLDAAGNVLASNSVEIGTSQSSYGLLTLPLTYPAHCAKAAQIVVVFKSTVNGASKSYLKMPSFASRSGEFVGGQLYIDDITLNY